MSTAKGMKDVNLVLYPVVVRHPTIDAPSSYTYEVSARFAADTHLDGDDRFLLDLKEKARELFSETHAESGGQATEKPKEGKLVKQWSEAVKTVATKLLANLENQLSGDALSAFLSFQESLEEDLQAEREELPGAPRTSAIRTLKSVRLATLCEQDLYLSSEEGCALPVTELPGLTSSAIQQGASTQVVDPTYAFKKD